MCSFLLNTNNTWHGTTTLYVTLTPTTPDNNVRLGKGKAKHDETIFDKIHYMKGWVKTDQAALFCILPWCILSFNHMKFLISTILEQVKHNGSYK